MITPRLIAERYAKRSTRWIGTRWGDSFPYYFVCGHPKSGSTWLARMVGDYLQLPFPQFAVLPLGFSCVILDHSGFHPKLRRVFYLYRDGRDVMVSLYFDRLRIARHSTRPGRGYVSRTYEKLFGRGYDPEDVTRHLPRFIEFEFCRPGRGTPLNWRDHIEDWFPAGGRRHVVCLSYEHLLTDCAGALGRAIEGVTEQQVDSWRIETTVEKMSMRRQTGRSPGDTDPAQHIRSGVSGEWRRHFSRQAAELFNELAGDTLVRLGYEADLSWPDTYDLPS